MAEGGGPEPGEQERSSGPRPPSARDLQVRRAAEGGARRVTARRGACRSPLLASAEPLPDPTWGLNCDSGIAGLFRAVHRTVLLEETSAKAQLSFAPVSFPLHPICILRSNCSFIMALCWGQLNGSLVGTSLRDLL